MSSMSATMRSTMICVLVCFTSLKSSVSASLALSRSSECGVAEVLAQASDQLDLNFFGALAGFGIGEDLFQHLRIEHKGFDVVAHRLQVDVCRPLTTNTTSKRFSTAPA